MNYILKPTACYIVYYRFNARVLGKPAELTRVEVNYRFGTRYLYDKSDPRLWDIEDYVDDKSYEDSRTLTQQMLNNPNAKKTVFVSKKCAIPRDVVRMNYKIVKDKSKADIIVMPYDNDDRGRMYRNMLYLKLDNGIEIEAILIKEYDSPDGDFSTVATQLQPAAQASFEKRYASLAKDVRILKDNTTFAIPKCDEYEDLIQDFLKPAAERTKQLYIKEDSLPIQDVPNPLTGQGLAMMAKHSDTKILEKLVTGSDWMKYPFTMYKFLHLNLEHRHRSSLSRSTTAVLDILDGKFNGYNEASQVIAPEDFNLYQDFCLAMLNVQGDRGFVSPSALDRYDRSLFSHMKTKIAVMKVPVDKEVDFIR